MKNLLVKTLCFILLLAMLSPLVIACNDDPPAGGGGGSGSGSGEGGGSGEGDGSGNGNTGEGEVTQTMNYIDAKLKNTVTTTIIDFNSEALVAKNEGLSQKLEIKDGKKAYRYEGSMQDYTRVYLPDEVDISDCHRITLEVYSESAADATVQLWLKNCSSPVDVKMDFTGWRTIEILIDAISVANPYPKIDRMELKQASGSVNPTVWIGKIEGHRDEFSLNVPSGVDLSDPAIYDKIIVNFREYLIGNKETQSLPAYQTKLVSVNNSCRSSWDSFRATYDNAVEKKNFLFDIDMRLGKHGYELVSWDWEKTYRIYEKIYQMAQAYAYEGSDYYKDPELLADIIKALDYCYDVFYGQCIVDEGTLGNWWPWDIGCPMQLIPILVFIEDALTLDRIKHYLVAYDYLMPFPVGSGANLCDMAVMVIVAGALERDAYRICQAKYLAGRLFDYVTIEQMGAGVDGGFFTDGSFIQHSVAPYAGAYGEVLVTTLPKMIGITNGTLFAFHGESLDNQFAWMFDTYQAIMYDGRLMGGHLGRSIGTDEIFKFNNLTKGMIYMLPYCPSDILPRFKSLVRTLMHQAGKSFYDSVPLIFSKMAAELYGDESVPIINDYFVTRIFGNMARVSHHGPEYGISIALSSKRIDKFESINGANFTGWYHGDGMIYIYSDGYNHDGQFFYYANPYHMPGTTVNSAKRLRGNIHPTIPNKYSYAGGAEQGRYGAVGYILGYDFATTRSTFVGGENATKIEAKKSYFLFDNEVVCLGSGITDASGTTVETVVENRKWRDTDKLYINGSEITGSALHVTNIVTPNSGKAESFWSCFDHPASDILTSDYLKTVKDVKTVHFSNMGGYVFLRTAEQDGGTLTYGKTVISGDATSGTITSWNSKGTQSFFEMTVNHGKGTDALNGKYAYVYLPDSTVAQTESYNTTPDIKLLALNDTAHAVYESKLGIFAANVFTDSGTTVKVTESGAPISKFEAQTACSVMISRNESGQTVISVCDPSQSYRNLVFSIYADGLTAVISADKGFTTDFDGGCVNITLNCDGNRGQTYTLILD